MEIPENEISPNSEGNSEEGEEITTQHYMLQQILRINYPSFIQHSIQLLLPRACQLLTHPDNDLRTVVLSSLRHSLAYYLSLYLLLIGRSSDSNGDGNGEDVPTAHIPVVQQLLQSIFTQMASLLQEEIPMPQYAIRLLVSLFSVAYTSPNAHQIKLADLLMSNLRSYGLVPILMEVLKVTSTTAMTNSNSISASGVAEQSSQVLGNMLDPQLLQLIRSVCEFHSKSSEDSQASISGVLLLIESEVAQSLSIATISTVYAYISYPYHSSSLPTSGSVGVALSASSSTAEVISLLLDVTYFVLHFVLKSLSDNSNNNHQMVNGAGAPVTRHIFSQQLRKAITAMQSISPALLMVMGYCEHLLASYPGSVASPPSNVDAEDTTTIAMATQWLDMSGRCLGMLFDIFPDILSSQLLSKQSVCLQQPQATPSSNTAIPQLPPRVILSKVLRNRRIDQKIQLKIVKILFGITKVGYS